MEKWCFFNSFNYYVKRYVNYVLKNNFKVEVYVFNNKLSIL